MGTEINISKRIAIEEEGVVVTSNVNNIDFVGSGVNTTAVGNDVTVTIPGSFGSTIFYLNESITQTPYKEFSSIATTTGQQIVSAAVGGGATATIAAFQTPAGIPGTTIIPGGLWQFYLHFDATTSGQDWIIRPLVYKRDTGGIETLILTSDPVPVTNMSTGVRMYVSDAVLPTTTLLVTDRIVVKINMQNTSGISQTVNFRTESSQHYSVVANTLNQNVPAAGVPSTRRITINGNAQDLSTDRIWNAFALVPTQTITSSATVTPTTVNQLVVVTAQSVALTIAAPSGTPVQGQPLMIRIKDNGTARAITFHSGPGGFRAIGATLPTTTVINKTTYIGCIYNSTDDFWDVIGVTTEA